MKRVCVLVAALLLLTVPAGAPTGQPAPVPKPSLSVDLSPAEQAVNYSSYVQDIVFFGRITLGNAPYAKYEVFLRSHDNPTWATSCTPDYVVFWGAGSAVFNLTVRVPMAESNHTTKIWVESRATYEDTDVAGNISAPVFVAVGPLAANPNITQDGDRFFGPVSGSGGMSMFVLALAISLVPVAAAVVWAARRSGKGAKKKRDGHSGQDHGPPGAE